MISFTVRMKFSTGPERDQTMTLPEFEAELRS